jgi:acid phosphatase family membrane protein YuiD
MSSALVPGLHPLLAVLDNGTLWWGLAACGLAQLSKLVIELVVHQRWNPKVLIETGGMPSSHSALITGTTACIGWQQGFDSPLFALAATLCFIVLYDASGVRRNAGLIAARVNELPEGLWSFDTAAGNGDIHGDGARAKGPESALKPLKESLGHTKPEVLVGSLMGPAIALPGLVLVGTPLHLATAWGLITPIG